MKNYDVIVIGSGSNGLAAAVHLQKQGLKTLVLEQSTTPGGATKTEETTLPGFKHDLGSAILPMAYASPFFRKLPLKDHGLEWVFPEIPFVHPFPDGSAHACYQDIEKTAAQFEDDGNSYKKLFGPLLGNWPQLEDSLLGPLAWPEHPVKLLKFGLKAFLPAKHLVNTCFKEEKTKLFFYGSAAHATLPLTNLASAAFGLVLGTMAHQNGWPFPKGGAGQFINSLLSYYHSLGGQLELNTKVRNLTALPEAKAYIFDLTPKQLLEIEGTDFPVLYRKRLENYRYGAGVFKIDWALSAPIPWTNEKCKRAGTVHLGFSQREMEISERSVHHNKENLRPYVLLAQHSLFDATRAPANHHTAWAYCHVPNGSLTDYTKAIEMQIEKVAPGFRNCILQRSTMNTKALENFNPNLIGGDINGGKQDITQLFTRPVARLSPYTTPNPQIYICSSSTPPGGGVHGMGGFHAAEKVLKDHFKEL